MKARTFSKTGVSFSHGSDAKNVIHLTKRVADKKVPRELSLQELTGKSSPPNPCFVETIALVAGERAACHVTCNTLQSRTALSGVHWEVKVNI